MDEEPPIPPFTRPPRAKGFSRPPPAEPRCPHCHGPLAVKVILDAPPEDPADGELARRLWQA